MVCNLSRHTKELVSILDLILSNSTTGKLDSGRTVLERKSVLLIS